MATDIYMPLMGLTMSEGTVVRWLKATGDPVKKGEPVLEIETDKATMELEAPSNGFLGKILVANGTLVAVGTVLSHVLEAGETIAESAAQKDAAPVAPASASEPALVEKAGNTIPKSALRTPNSKILSSPLARRVAQEHNVDLAEVDASGPGGRIVVADVRWYLEEQEKKGAAGKTSAVVNTTAVQLDNLPIPPSPYPYAPADWLHCDDDNGSCHRARLFYTLNWTPCVLPPVVRFTTAPLRYEPGESLCNHDLNMVKPLRQRFGQCLL